MVCFSLVDVKGSGGKSGGKRTSKIMALPLPPGGGDSGNDDVDGEGGAGKKVKRKPRVIGKVTRDIRMSEDGSEWGERYVLTFRTNSCSLSTAVIKVTGNRLDYR